MSDFAAATGNGIVEETPDIVLQPLTRHRLMDALERASIAYTVDRDREISSDWGQYRVWFDIVGRKSQVLSVRGLWNGWLPADRRVDLLESCNAWNERMQMLRPYVYVDADSDLRVFADHVVDYEFGVSDEQLYQHVSSMTTLAAVFFEDLDEEYPEALGL